MHPKNSHCVCVALPQGPCDVSNNKSWQRKDTIIKHCTVRHCCEFSSHLCLFITECLGQDESKIGLETHLSTLCLFNASSLVPERLSSACTLKAEPSSCYWFRQNPNSLMELEGPRKGHSKTSKKRLLADTKSLLNQDDYINHSWQNLRGSQDWMKRLLGSLLHLFLSPSVTSLPTLRDP